MTNEAMAPAAKFRRRFYQILLLGWGFPIVAFAITRRTMMDKEIRAYYEN